MKKIIILFVIVNGVTFTLQAQEIREKASPPIVITQEMRQQTLDIEKARLEQRKVELEKMKSTPQAPALSADEVSRLVIQQEREMQQRRKSLNENNESYQYTEPLNAQVVDAQKVNAIKLTNAKLSDVELNIPVKNIEIKNSPANKQQGNMQSVGSQALSKEQLEFQKATQSGSGNRNEVFIPSKANKPIPVQVTNVNEQSQVQSPATAHSTISPEQLEFQKATQSGSGNRHETSSLRPIKSIETVIPTTDVNQTGDSQSTTPRPLSKEQVEFQKATQSGIGGKR